MKYFMVFKDSKGSMNFSLLKKVKNEFRTRGRILPPPLYHGAKVLKTKGRVGRKKGVPALK